MNKLTLSTAVLTLGTFASFGAFAEGYGDTSAKTGGDSVYNESNQRTQDGSMQNQRTQDGSMQNQTSQNRPTQNTQTEQFSSVDRDKDGYITEEELSSIDPQQEFDKVDADSDGRVSERELQEATAMQGGDW